ncbi:MAG: baseplate J/gp47 family protein [Clostridiales bacterium]|nr:baseplate J/gp47 family protein [Clostridiales bacterium]
MSLTYNEILNEMKTAFYNESGEAVKELSDLELRFKAVASEIYSVCANADFVLKQAFVQTATGEYLENHAELRGITRKTPSKANGMLEFYISEPSEKDIQIPSGTVCSVKNNPLIQFATVEKGIIPAGELSVKINALALANGEEFNTGADTVTVMVNPPEYIEGVKNEYAFTGGSDYESDEALRQRVISSYSVLNNAVNAGSVCELILTLDEVLDAYAAFESGTLRICLKTRSGAIDNQLINKIDDFLFFATSCGVSTVYIDAEKSEFSVFAAVKILSGADREKVESEVRQRITEICSAEKIGKEITASEIMAALYDIDGVEYTEVSLSPAVCGVVACKTNNYLKMADLQVELYE